MNISKANLLVRNKCLHASFAATPTQAPLVVFLHPYHLPNHAMLFEPAAALVAFVVIMIVVIVVALKPFVVVMILVVVVAVKLIVVVILVVS